MIERRRDLTFVDGDGVKVTGFQLRTIGDAAASGNRQPRGLMKNVVLTLPG
jgi:hypothetical protein